MHPEDLSAPGEDLAARLAHGPLGVPEAVTLVKRLASLLVLVHAHGIVHGGIEPAAVVLPGGSIGAARLLGGSARSPTGRTARALAYLSPEQIRGEPVDARADVFALGCVLFEAISGRGAFAAVSPVASLAKVLLEEVPRLSGSRTDVPDALDELMTRMLAKSSYDRPYDSRALHEELGALDLDEATWGAAPATAPDELPERARRRLYLLMATPPPGTSVPAVRNAISGEISSLGAPVDVFADGSAVAAMGGRGNALEQAARAARAALAIRRALPYAAIAALTGAGVVEGELPVGEVIDRAAKALLTPPPPPAIRIDEALAGLLDAPFEIGGDEHGLTLIGEGAAAESSPSRPAPAGRERELAGLTAIFRAAVDEEVGRGVIVVGPGGSGKSRLASALLGRAEEGGEPVRVLSARGIRDRAEVAWSLASQLVREAAGLGDAEPAAVQRMKLRGRVRRHVASRHVARVADRLAEVAGIPRIDGAERDEPSDVAEAARARALEDFLGPECDARPVLLVLDDLHWADAASLGALDAVLGALGERRLMVLGLGRPEVHARFPGLWGAHDVARIEL